MVLLNQLPHRRMLFRIICGKDLGSCFRELVTQKHEENSLIAKVIDLPMLEGILPLFERWPSEGLFQQEHSAPTVVLAAFCELCTIDMASNLGL